jgi:hypothetical protein
MCVVASRHPQSEDQNMAKTHDLPVVSPGSNPGIGRRNVLRGLLTGAGAGLALPGVTGAHPLAEHAHHPERIEDARASVKESPRDPEFLDAYQLEMLEALGERIVPGAAAAGCARFIDRLLSVGERAERERFLSALGAVDARARARFATPWPRLDAEQQRELLAEGFASRPGREEVPWTPGSSVADHLASVPRGAGVTFRDQLDHLKGWVVGAYYTSETGLRELGWDGPVYADSFPGCPHPDGHRER